MKENYQGLLDLTNNDISVLTQNTGKLTVEVDPYKNLIIEPLYDECQPFVVGDKEIHGDQFWLQFYFESTVIDMSLEPSLTVVLKPAIEEAEVCYLLSPGMDLEGVSPQNEPTQHHLHLNQLLAEWVEYLQERQVMIEGETEKINLLPKPG